MGWTLAELKRFRDERATLLCQRTGEIQRLRRQLLELYGWMLAPKDPLQPETIEAYKLVLAAHGFPLDDGVGSVGRALHYRSFDPSI